MANYLASIFGTEQDKVSTPPINLPTELTPSPGQLLLLLQNRRLPARRPLLTQTCQTVLLADDSPAQPLPKSGL